MPLTLMYITNNPTIADIAQRAGVDRIFIDLEQLGKKERQKGLDSVKSNHTIQDIARLRSLICTSELLVRVNPLNDLSQREINAVIERGADIVMLPMWKTEEEVKRFIGYVDGRVKTMLLLETKEAAASMNEILAVDGIDEIHIGLNDLHLSYGLTFMFELLTNGTVEKLCNSIRPHGIPYGFGGIARIGEGMLPAEYILAEHYRLGSSMVILSRSFCNSQDCAMANLEKIFVRGVTDIRECEARMSDWLPVQFEENRKKICTRVQLITENARHGTMRNVN